MCESDGVCCQHSLWQTCEGAQNITQDTIKPVLCDHCILNGCRITTRKTVCFLAHPAETPRHQQPAAGKTHTQHTDDKSARTDVVLLAHASTRTVIQPSSYNLDIVPRNTAEIRLRLNPNPHVGDTSLSRSFPPIFTFSLPSQPHGSLTETL